MKRAPKTPICGRCEGSNLTINEAANPAHSTVVCASCGFVMGRDYWRGIVRKQAAGRAARKAATSSPFAMGDLRYMDAKNRANGRATRVVSGGAPSLGKRKP